MKKCGRCNKETDDFSSRGIKRTDLQSWCRDCRRSKDKERQFLLKFEALEKYGGTFCKCCGLHEPRFLSLDHVDNDGAEQRRKHKHGTGNAFYSWLKRNNYPIDLNLQVLCHNCNLGRHANGGICPCIGMPHFN